MTPIMNETTPNSATIEAMSFMVTAIAPAEISLTPCKPRIKPLSPTKGPKRIVKKKMGRMK